MAPMPAIDGYAPSIEADGWAITPGVYDAGECYDIAERLTAALASLRRANGAIYGERNLLDLFPDVMRLWRRPPLLDVLFGVLGPDCGLVRGLFFDKPPEGSWSLPWHRDLTIAVREHRPSDLFRNPTTKAGVPHVEAPDVVLRQMLTLRIHLDDATPDNGPLQIVPGSHTGRDAPAERTPVTILAQAGDVLAMRPLLLHASGESRCPASHRRVIHLEFAGCETLPDGYRWRQFGAI